MAFVNFQRYVCDVCGKTATQDGTVDWFTLSRQVREPHCFMGYAVDVCSVECLGRASIMPMNQFMRLRRDTEKRANVMQGT